MTQGEKGLRSRSVGNQTSISMPALLALHLAFAAPQLVAWSTDRRPTAAMRLLDHLSKTKYDREHVNEIENIRSEIQHNTSAGHPSEIVTLEGEPQLEVVHAQWVSSVLRWTSGIKSGMTREDLRNVYTEEGGLSTRAHGTYVLKGCPGIKVDVEFIPVGE